MNKPSTTEQFELITPFKRSDLGTWIDQIEFNLKETRRFKSKPLLGLIPQVHCSTKQMTPNLFKKYRYQVNVWNV